MVDWRRWLGATSAVLVLCCASACGGDDATQETPPQDGSLPASDAASADHAVVTSDASLGAADHTIEGDGASDTAPTIDTSTPVDMDRMAPSDHADQDIADRDAASDSVADTVVTDAPMPSDAASDVPSDAPGDTAEATAVVEKSELDRCADDDECMTGLSCFAYGTGRPKRCTRPCTTVGASAECPGNSRCEKFPSVGNFCVPSDIGRSCSSSDDCHFGCITAQHYCTSACSSGSDCPNGFGCMAVGQQRVCVKVAADCSGDTTQCISPSACDTTASLIVNSCTIACNTAADCPRRAQGLPAWTCSNNGLCRRPSDVFGPLANGSGAQYACNALSQPVNVCNDGRNIDLSNFTIPNPPAVSCVATTTTSGAPGDTCLDSCRYQGGCADGYACIAIDSIASARVGICLPRGSGEVGDACTKNGDCDFGYCVGNTGKCSRDCTADGLCPTGSSCVPAGGPAVEGVPFRRCE